MTELGLTWKKIIYVTFMAGANGRRKRSASHSCTACKIRGGNRAHSSYEGNDFSGELRRK